MKLVEGFVTKVCNQCNNVEREHRDDCSICLSKDRRIAKFNEVQE